MSGKLSRKPVARSVFGAPAPALLLLLRHLQALASAEPPGAAVAYAAQVVFIPGLEQNILPGAKRIPYPGLVLEAARMLYVSITRARVACALSFTRHRFVNGQATVPTPSDFATHLGGKFDTRNADGISKDAAEQLQKWATEMSA